MSNNSESVQVLEFVLLLFAAWRDSFLHTTKSVGSALKLLAQILAATVRDGMPQQRYPFDGM